MGRHKLPIEVRRSNDARKARRWYAANKEYSCAKNKAYRLKNKERLYHYARRRLIKKRYGLDMDQAVAMWVAQDKKCAICFRELASPEFAVKGRKDLPFIDHSHETLKVRGILCAGCNLALGLLEDDIQ